MKNSDSSFEEELETLRSKLLVVDDRILDAIGDRFALVRKIGELKQTYHKPIEDLSREEANLQRHLLRTKGKLPSDFVSELLKVLLKWSKIVQSKN